MTGPALLDVNILVALFDPTHVHHDLAHDWFAGQRQHGWATCPITENGFVRVLSNLTVDGSVQAPGALIDGLRKFCASGHHVFWSETVSLRDRKLFDLSKIGSHRHLTDVYLLGLARRMNGRLATFDHSIPSKAVLGAPRDTLLVVSPVDEG